LTREMPMQGYRMNLSVNVSGARARR
jgi:hypothetical protein